jgi:integrase
LEPYVVLRGAAPAPWYRRRIPEALRPAMGNASTITRKLAGHPRGTVTERRLYLSSYARIHGEAEQQLAAAEQGPRQLTAAEQLGVAGSWASAAPPRPADPTDAAEALALLQAMLDLGLAAAPAATELEGLSVEVLADAALALLPRIHGLAHPGCLPMPPGALVIGSRWNPALAAAWMAEVLAAAAPVIAPWQQQAAAELHRLGVVVDGAEQLQVAMRLAAAATALSQQQAQLESGRLPQPLQFPPPPRPTASSSTFTTALRRWQTLRQPTSKTVQDAAARLAELAAHAGHDRLEALSPDQASSWRDALLSDLAPATVRRRIALVKAVLTTAAADGLPVGPGVIERLAVGKVKAASGTTAKRRAFTATEARTLIEVSRTITSTRAIDRWGFPLGLATGARLEELAGLRPQDVRQIDGIWVVVIEPHELRRLKNSSSARSVPIPDALLQEGFLTWAQQQEGPLLFPEPEPPAADPRCSHYASIRLGKVLRKQAGIADPSATFHSTRHTVAQALLDAGIEQRQIEGITGHASRSMVAGYSRGGPPLHLLAEAQGHRDWTWWPAPVSGTPER